MAVPSAITDLSTTVASNSPAGSESPSLIDDYLRAQAGFLAQMYSGNAPLLSSVAGTDTITGTVTPTPTAYAAGQVFRFISAGANTTTAVTLNVSSLGAKSVTKLGANALAAGDIPSGAVVQVVYDGTRFQIIGLTSQIAAAINTMTSPLTITVNGTTPITADTSGNISLPLGTANQVQYLNGSKVLSGSANLTFDGTTLTPNALTVTNAVTLNGGTANGVPYLNGSKVLTSGSALTFDGNRLTVSSATPSIRLDDTNATGAYGLDWYLSGLGVSRGNITLDAATGEMQFQAGASGSPGWFQTFLLSGSEQMRLTSTGLGIGTSSPGYKLDVSTAGTAALRVTTGDYGLSTFSNGTSTIKIQNQGSVGYIGTSSNNALAFVTNDTTKAVIDASGNLGLGVTPSAWTSSIKSIDLPAGSFATASAGNGVVVARNAYFNGTNWIYRSTETATQYDQSSGAHKWYTAPSGTAGAAITFTQAMTLDANGNLGVGGSPNNYAGYKTLAVIGPDTTHSGIVRVRTSDDGIGVNIYADATGPMFNTTNHPLRFLISDTERARIDSSGNLLVGTTTTVGRMTLNGNAGGLHGYYHAQSVSGGYSFVSDCVSNGGTYYHAQFKQAGTAVGSITSTGSTTSYLTSSDYRLKENIQPMTGALAKVAALKPVTYTWKSDGSAGEGFIAHELAEVAPQCVTGEKDAVDADGNPQYQGIDVSFLVGTLTAAIQEQQVIIESLTSRIAALEAK